MPPETPAHADPHTWKRWLHGDSAWFTTAVSLAAVVAACGFVLSFNRLGSGARLDGVHPWWLLPLSLDAPIPVFIVADHYLVSRGYRSLFARACAWGFAALTVALNVAPPTSPLWHWARVAAPAAWILGIEAVRRMYKAHRLGARTATDRAPVTEWLGAFRATRRLWRRKLALGVPSWSAMRHLEDARLLVADLAAARENAGQPVPAAVARTVTTGWLPAGLAQAVTTTAPTEWEPLVTAWAARQMALPATLLAAITDASAPPRKPGGGTGTRNRGRKPRRNPGRNPGAEQDGDSALSIEARALALLQGDDPPANGTQLGSRLDVSDSYGRRLFRQLAGSVPIGNQSNGGNE